MTRMESATAFRTGRWEFVSSLTSARFTARNFGFRMVAGQFPVTDAWVDVHDGRPVGVHARLEVAGVDTANAQRDGHLRSARLLDAAHYPVLAFDAFDAAGAPIDTGGAGIDTGGAVEQVGGAEWRLSGTLAAHGMTIPLDVHATVSRSATGSIVVSARSELDRRTVGVTAPRILIGHRIAIDLDVASAPPA